MAIRWVFLHDEDGNPYTQANPLDVTASFSGLRIAGRVTIVTLNTTTWTALPAVPLANRNAIRIQNRSGVEFKLNYDPLEPEYVGVVIDGNWDEFKDITSTIVVYAKASSGTPQIAIEELS